MFLLFLSPWDYEVLNEMQAEADEIIALRHFIILKQIYDWLQGGIAASSFFGTFWWYSFLGELQVHQWHTLRFRHIEWFWS
jgi:hypothetical protein